MAAAHLAIAAIVIAGLLVAGCTEPPREAERRDAETGRWYTVEQVMQGAPLYVAYCASCHGGQAEGAEEWRRRLPDGRWRPPPLNGTAHTWHHPLWQLRQQIREGSDPEHGDMPPFADILSAAEIDAVIAWFQSHWPDRIYAAWLDYDANFPAP
ncbi:Cytochrome c, class I [Thioalkalivibrio nitratireducens DSM 14787]|uniref:Cytochrome c, class I n=1 Tax=Thioalkalivibrio nitratireducens (strain DSM 14787 / UNIQEM 213 / ALEN2) TaxID=1255043 RepID=L0DZ25_THIND|nr:Cytochrome c, class I [Thioalkalivibrio nitratireducens DSM 14787]